MNKVNKNSHFKAPQPKDPRIVPDDMDSKGFYGVDSDRDVDRFMCSGTQVKVIGNQIHHSSSFSRNLIESGPLKAKEENAFIEESNTNIYYLLFIFIPY